MGQKRNGWNISDCIRLSRPKKNGLLILTQITLITDGEGKKRRKVGGNMAVVMAYENDLAKGKKGETHPNAVLTEKQAIEIYVRANKGENQRKLSEEFGIAQSVVSQIKIGSRWPHLSEVSGD